MEHSVSAGVAERAIREGQVAMPADRLFHARLGHSAKVARLSDLGFRVWTTYVLGADDFGVMRADAVAFQAAHDALRTRPAAEVTSSIAQLVEVGLVAPFAHQGAEYLYQADWQDFQRVRFPTRTLHPLPTCGPPIRAGCGCRRRPGRPPRRPPHCSRSPDAVPHSVRNTSAHLPKRLCTSHPGASRSP